jgi:hypothetical protein
VITFREDASNLNSAKIGVSTYRELMKEVSRYKIGLSESKITPRAEGKLPLASIKQYALNSYGKLIT